MIFIVCYVTMCCKIVTWKIVTYQWLLLFLICGTVIEVVKNKSCAVELFYFRCLNMTIRTTVITILSQKWTKNCWYYSLPSSTTDTAYRRFGYTTGGRLRYIRTIEQLARFTPITTVLWYRQENILTDTPFTLLYLLHQQIICIYTKCTNE